MQNERLRKGVVETHPPVRMLERDGVDVISPEQAKFLPASRGARFRITRVEAPDHVRDGKDALCVVSFTYWPGEDTKATSVLVRGAGDRDRGMWKLVSVAEHQSVDVIRAVVVEGVRGRGVVVTQFLTVPQVIVEEIGHEACEIASDHGLLHRFDCDEEDSRGAA